MNQEIPTALSGNFTKKPDKPQPPAEPERPSFHSAEEASVGTAVSSSAHRAVGQDALHRPADHDTGPSNVVARREPTGIVPAQPPAEPAKRRVYIPIMIEHMHFLIGKAEKDEITLERLAREDEDRPQDIWDRTIGERRRDALKLLALIEEANGEHTETQAQCTA